jgi:polyhydroxybutyrate depolymerase
VLRIAACAALVACGGSAAEPPRVFGGDRPVTLQVPEGEGGPGPLPLLLILHGYGATGLLQQAYLGFVGAADDRGILVAAPEGTVDADGKPFWNASDACCDFYGSGVDDVAYLGGLIDDIRAAYDVDPDRVYVIGHSNGGFMSYRLACERSDAIAAIMSLAGAAAFQDPDTCRPEEPVSVLSIHGDADTDVLYDGSTAEPGGYPGAVASIERWADDDGCAGGLEATGELDLDQRLDGAETERSAAAGCPDGIGAELWTLRGGTHVPSFAQPLTADEVWAWLEAHPKR